MTDSTEFDIDIGSLINEPRDVLVQKLKAKRAYELRRSKEICEESLSEFIKAAWHVVEPAQPYIHNWHVDFISAHLEAVTDGEITRLLINVPPGPGWVENLVTTTNGRVRLGDISVGDMVLTHVGRYRRVTACYPKGKMPTLRIVTKSGRETFATPDHNFLTPYGWVEAEKLRVNDVLASVTPEEDISTNKISLEEARLLGYLIGDGGITHNVQFTNKDEDVVEDFEKCVLAVGFTTNKSFYKTHWTVRINGGKRVKDWLESHDILGASSYTKFIPVAVLQSSKEVVKNFIGAYWSCDGMFDVRSTKKRGSRYRASATTVSERLARDLQHALSIIGIRSIFRKKERKLETAAQPGGIYRSFNIEIYSEYDTAKFKDLPGLSERKNKTVYLCGSKKFDCVLNEDPIVLIEDAGERECMCVSVEDDHSLVWDGLVVHNSMKSLLVNVFWPSWEWIKNPSIRYICTAHSQNLAIRDSIKMRRLVTSDWYQQRWGDKVRLTSDQAAKTKFENTATGFREAVAFESMTGVRGDRVTIDDPHSVDSALSDVQRQSTVNTFLEAVPTRLTNPATSAIIVIMQRLNVDDLSGVILEKNLGYHHIMLPMEFDPARKCVTSLGYEDPREEENELLFEARFPREVVDRDKEVMGPWAVAGQFQQTPTPRGGGIIKREWWQLWDDETARANGVSTCNKYPPMDYIIASLDPAYTEKKENDPSALTIWGVWQRGGQSARRILSRSGDVADILDDRDTVPSLMLMHAWEKRLPIHGPELVREPGEPEFMFNKRQRENWGLVEWVISTCNMYNVDMLLVEAKGPGLSVSQEIKRLNKVNTWGVHLINPGNADKVARTYAVQPIFSNGAIYAPDKEWAEKVIAQFESFPKSKHDDFVDSSTQALRYLREKNLIRRPEEIIADIKFDGQYKRPDRPAYDV